MRTNTNWHDRTGLDNGLRWFTCVCVCGMRFNGKSTVYKDSEGTNGGSILAVATCYKTIQRNQTFILNMLSGRATKRVPASEVPQQVPHRASYSDCGPSDDLSLPRMCGTPKTFNSLLQS